MGVVIEQGAALLIGGAGTGKTTRLVEHASALLDGGARGVCLLVRDRRTATARREQLIAAVGATDAATVTTPHAFALSILRRGWRLLGHDHEPSLLSAPEQFALVEELLASPEEHGRWDRFAKARTLVGFVNALREFVLRAQDAAIDPTELAERARMARRDDLGEAARFFRRYLDALDQAGSVEHANAICQATALLLPDADDTPEIAAARASLIAAVRAEASHLVIDDLHAFTPAMFRLLAALRAPGGTLCTALDLNAPSEAFRGSSLDPVAELRAVAPDLRVTTLETRYRPRPEVSGVRYLHVSDEIAGVVNEVLHAHRRLGLAWTDIGIIVRKLGPTTDLLRRALARDGVPVAIVGENRALHAEPALQPLLDLATVTFEIAERDAVLPRLLASSIGGFSASDLRRLHAVAKSHQTSLDGLFAAPSDLPDDLRQPLLRVRALVEDLAERDASDARADEVAWWLWTTLPLAASLLETGDEHALDAFGSFHATVARFSERRGGARFSEFVRIFRAADFGPEAWAGPEDRQGDRVRILTAFAALGREFELVLAPGCVDGAFPDLRERVWALDLRDLTKPADPVTRRLERGVHEQRLFDAVLARARSTIVLSAAIEGTDGRALAPTPLAAARGIVFADAPTDPPIEALTRDRFEALHRRRLADPKTNDTERAEALEVLSALPGVDPDTWWSEHEWSDLSLDLYEDRELRTSYSRLSSYDNCPLEYLLKVECGLDEGEKHAMTFGSWIHEIIEHASLRVLEDAATSTHEELIALLDQRWDPTIFPANAIATRRRADAEQILRRWRTVDGEVSPVAVEAPFQFDHEGVLIRGKIDRIVACGSKGARVTDYKTSRGWRTQAEIDDDLQLAIYHLAMLRDLRLAVHGKPMHLELAFVDQPSRDGFKRIGFSPRDGFEAGVVARLDGILKGIFAGEFAPSSAANCQWCPLKRLCPVWPEGDEVVL